MVRRVLWLQALERAWERRSVVWLAGVRRSGKTSLCQTLDDTVYLDCELPRVRRALEDPEAFLRSTTGQRIVLDEIHRLADPSELLKIAADHFPTTRLVATGSSTLDASAKFRDTLTGRRETLWLTPMIAADSTAFGDDDLSHRFLHGGLPPHFLSPTVPERDFVEWIDSYWAKDVQELFKLERRWSFARFVELLLSSSGGMFEATRYAGPCEVSRQTISNYLAVLETTFVVQVVRPYSRRRTTEIVAAPKVYGFDTGFVCHYRGWDSLRPDDCGELWEHFVLNEIQARLQRRAVRYWRNKRGAEIDFVLPRRGERGPVAIECKWRASAFDASSLGSFRQLHPGGPNYVVAPDVSEPYLRTHGDLDVEYVPLTVLVERLEAEPLA